MPNLNFIKEHGIEKFIGQQKKRIRLLETMIDNFDDGRSKSFYCKSATLLDLGDIRDSLDKTIEKTKTDGIEPNDIKTRAKILKDILSGATPKDSG